MSAIFEYIAEKISRYRQPVGETRRVRYPPLSAADSPFVDNTVTNTKYAWWNFIILNAYYQFKQNMNRYFLLIALLQLWALIAPVNPLTTWIPLGVIFSISAFKEGYDDLLRLRADNALNRRPTKILVDGSVTEVQARSVHVGDILYIRCDEEIAADCVLLKSSSHTAYIQTANIDGETNLKARTPLGVTNDMSIAEIGRLEFTIECAHPNKNIYQFDSTFTTHSETAPLTTDNLLLQSTQLRNTDECYALVVYTGNETKISQNKSLPRQKYTKIDHFINRTTAAVFAFQIACILVLGTIGTVYMYQDIGSEEKSPGVPVEDGIWYLYPYELRQKPYTTDWYEPIVIPLRFLLLASMMIPISLKVSLDLIKFAYSWFINNDILMFDAERNTPANAANSSISEDLGQVQYVLSDKTGTLTENEMIFRCIATTSDRFGENEADRDARISAADFASAVQSGNKDALQLARMMTFCNTVVPSVAGRSPPPLSPHSQTQSHSLDYKSDETAVDYNIHNNNNNNGNNTNNHQQPIDDDTTAREYASSSPDELSLVQYSASIGCVLLSRQDNLVHVRISGTLESYRILQTLEFSSTRKRMSILFQPANNTSGDVYLWSKGADDVMIERCQQNQAEHDRITRFKSILDFYASKGLRTLCYATRRISATEYSAWNERFCAANISIHKREESLAAVYDDIEKNLSLCGVSGIEDRLQADVADTLQTLRDAGVRVWMLTGDKMATAVEISRSCGLIATSDHIQYVTGVDGASVRESLELRLPQEDSSYALVIDGATLAIALTSHAQTFYDLAANAVAVVCCRVTPSQKASVVLLLNERQHITLAIGDGGNDVAMIQASSIGVGISGREGLQAARAADYSISKFSYLKRLILIHGHWSYYRTCFVAQYCFYKSIFICFIQLYFAFASRFSGASFLDSVSLTTYNILYTSLPAFFYVLEQDLSSNMLLSHPKLYEISRNGTQFTVITMLGWCLRAVYQSVVVVIFSWICSHGTSALSFGDNGQFSTAVLAYTAVVIIQCLTMYLEFTYITVYQHIVIWATILLFFLVNIILALIESLDQYGVFFTLMDDPEYWARITIISAVCLGPVFIFKYLRFHFYPALLHQAQKEDILQTRAVHSSVSHDVSHERGPSNNLRSPLLLDIQDAHD